LPGAIFIDHDRLLDDAQCKCLLKYLQQKHGLHMRRRDIIVDRRVVNASTDHGLLVSDAQFDRDYYNERVYLDELPAWVIKLSEKPYFSTDSIHQAVQRASEIIFERNGKAEEFASR